MKKLNAIALALSASVVGFAGAAQAGHGWSTYHWARQAHPMPLKLIDSVSQDWQFEFNTSISEWNDSTMLNMSVAAADDSNKTRKRCNAVTGQVRVCNAAYGFNGWLGLATIGLDSNGHIDQGTAKMNDSYSNYWNNDPKEKRHVMCQEIGHDFGLGHTSEDGSSQNTCMDYSTSPTSLSPNAHDYEQLLAQHDHFDSYNSYDDGSGGGEPCRGGPKKCGSNFNAPAGVPAGAIRVDKNKFEEVWVKGRPDGGHWVYHIRLVPEGFEK